jgi:glycerate-2-kinase
LGGRNQQLVLAALERLGDRTEGILILSGGTDGEDGPTDAAGALVDQTIAAAARHRGLDAGDHLRRNDAYRFFQPLGGLIQTGPTHTNVCDVRVVLVDRQEFVFGV